MDSFALFISNDPIRRGAIVRKVTISLPFHEERYKNSQSLRLFIQALKQLHNLVILRIFGVENWFSLDDEIGDTVAGLRNLRALCLHSRHDESRGDRCIDVLGRLSSPLEGLELGLRPSAECPDLFQTLGPLSPTLTNLSADKMDLAAKDSGTVYLNIKDLHFGSLCKDKLSI